MNTNARRAASKAMGWATTYQSKRDLNAEVLAALCAEHVAYRIAIVCDPDWAAWAEPAVGRLLGAAGRAQFREHSVRVSGKTVYGCRARRGMLLAAGDIVRCTITRGRGRRRLTPGSHRAAVSLITALCPEKRRTGLGVFLAAACPDVHDEAGITLTRRDLLPALTNDDPGVRELAMRLTTAVAA